MKKTKEKIRFYLVAIAICVISFVLCITDSLYSVDKIFSDPLYYMQTPTDTDIKIIAIDEKTLDELGPVTTWTRDVSSELIEKLTENKETAPAIIAFDIMYIGEIDSESDQRFATVAKEAGNVVTAVNIVWRPDGSLDDQGNYVIDNDYIEMIEYPYESLKNGTDYGFANTVQDMDGYIRYAKTSVTYGQETIDSFALKIYKAYCREQGIEPVIPQTFDDDLFYFAYSGKNDAYEVISLTDVIHDRIDIKAFADSVVLVGAYAPGMQDAYNVAVQKGAQMYGVEIHANIVEALVEQKTAVPVDGWIYALTVTAIALGFYFVSGRLKSVSGAILLVLLTLANIIIGRLLYVNGYVVDIIYIPVILVAIYVYQIGVKYLTELLQKRKVMKAFKKYVAPQIVDKIYKQGDFQIELGGENRHIAVLFIDIRGFTSLSEKLEPGEVVEILNEYLSLTTSAILKNGGTLDKFIGDATMAVFNAPFDLEDYIYKSVCTAKDIVAGSDKLQEKLLERFGRTVDFGIGINCGEAVVGNIGCNFRMDYTAIGDTVNTAARLESNAASGQILISNEIYEAVKDRVEVTKVGELSLKGKSNGVLVWQLDKVL